MLTAYSGLKTMAYANGKKMLSRWMRQQQVSVKGHLLSGGERGRPAGSSSLRPLPLPLPPCCLDSSTIPWPCTHRLTLQITDAPPTAEAFIGLEKQVHTHQVCDKSLCYLDRKPYCCVSIQTLWSGQLQQRVAQDEPCHQCKR